MNLSQFLLNIKVREKVEGEGKITLKSNKGLVQWVWRDKNGKWKELYGRNKNVEIYIRRRFDENK